MFTVEPPSIGHFGLVIVFFIERLSSFGGQNDSIFIERPEGNGPLLKI